MRKIIGVTVGTPLSPEGIRRKIKPVMSVNGKTADENGNVVVNTGSGGNGLSAYDVAVKNGFKGTEVEWLASLQGDPGATPEKGVDYYTDSDKAEIVDDVLKADVLVQMQRDMAEIKADLNYVAIDITSISKNVNSLYEIGTKLDTVIVSWAVNKQPVSQTFDGVAVDASVRSKTVSNVSSNKTFTVTATDERNKTDSASTSVTFSNGVYYGVLTDGVTIDSAAVKTMTKELKTSLGITFTATANNGQRHAFACPSRYGTAVFIDGETNFPAGFSWAATILFENDSGYKEDYDVYFAENAGLGKMTIAVSKGV